MSNEFSPGASHLTERHGFGFDELETGTPDELILEEIHESLHRQESENDLSTHLHGVALIALHSGEPVEQFNNEKEAMSWATRRFGPEAGKEYRVALAWEECV